MKLVVKIAGIIYKESINLVLNEEVPDGLNISELFKLLDKSKALKGKKYFSKILNLPKPPVLLVNGERKEIPEDLQLVLKDGDEISLISPMSGG